MPKMPCCITMRHNAMMAHQKLCKMPYKITLIQLSDLHLDADFNSQSAILHSPSCQNFLKTLTHSRTHRPNGYILTGDLVNGGQRLGYDWIFKQLSSTNLPFWATAGNHDVTHELNAHLPFFERTFLPIMADERLIKHACINLGRYNLIMLNSSIEGQTYGDLSKKQWHFLDSTLRAYQKNTIIALHHPFMRVRSSWIDAHKLQNSAQLMNLIKTHQHIRAIFSGHVHQSFCEKIHHAKFYTCPSTNTQFIPRQTQFAQNSDSIGYRVIKLHHNGLCTSFSVQLPCNAPKS